MYLRLFVLELNQNRNLSKTEKLILKMFFPALLKTIENFKFGLDLLSHRIRYC